MANPTCSATTLITNGACFRESTLNPNQQLCMLIYGMTLELKGIGGTDYTSDLPTLLSDAATLLGALEKDELMAGLIARQFANATAAGATVPDALADKMAAIACIQNLPRSPLQLWQIYLLLFCKLGVHKAYVQ